MKDKSKMIVLISTPCIAPGIMPSGIALLKTCLVQAGEKVRCFFLANEFEILLRRNDPAMEEIYCEASEIGSDWHSPFFSGLVFGHENPEVLVKKAVRLVFTGRTQLAARIDVCTASEREWYSGLKKETLNALSFCRTLRSFCDQKAEYIASLSPSLIGFSCLSSQLFITLYMAKIIKCKCPSATVVLGGGFLTEWNADFYANSLPSIDHIVVGNNVKRITELLKGINGRGHKSNLLLAGEQRSDKHYLVPDYQDGLPLLRCTNRPDVSIPLSNSRRCHWGHCKFCPAEQGPGSDKNWHPDEVSTTITRLASENGITGFMFSEWEINVDTSKLLKFCENMHLSGRRLHYWGEFSPASCSRQLFSSMVNSGRWCLQMGVESFSDDLLKLMGKRQTVVDNIKAIRLSLEEGIPLVYFNLIHAFPGTKARHVRETKSVIRKISHLLSDSRISVQLEPCECYRQRSSVGNKGVLAETHYLPEHLKEDFPTQLILAAGRDRLFHLWKEILDELSNLESSYFCAFETCKSIVLEDCRTEKKTSTTLEGLEADLVRCLLDDTYNATSLTKLIGTPKQKVEEGLYALCELGILAKSHDRYIALPTRG